MSHLYFLLPLTGLLFFIPSSSSRSNGLYPVSCETRGSDLKQDEVLVLCPPDCLQVRPSVFGSDVYAAISSICGAAVHRGILGPSGGPVRLQKQQGRRSYVSSYANGIHSQALHQWTASFHLSKTVDAPLELTNSARATAQPAATRPEKKAMKSSVKQGENTDCQMDIAIIMDSSSNIGQRRFNLQKNFVTKLAAMLRVGPTGPHLGLIQTRLITPLLSHIIPHHQMF